tara:strand:- start:4315 stop:4761 length:447 start_codon:yes stop_codon:yes gene_type:complete
MKIKFALSTAEIHGLATNLREKALLSESEVKTHLHRIGTMMLKNLGTADPFKRKEAIVSAIHESAENGKVAVVFGGRDCDMAQWDNRVTLLPATFAHVSKWADDYMEAAEGHQWWHVEKPSSAEDIEESSRDLALEAHENGHPHIVHI